MKPTSLVRSYLKPRKKRRGRRVQRAMRKAYSRFEAQYPSLTCSLFDWHFLTHGAEGALESVSFGPIEPKALALAEAWAEQLAGFNRERKERIAEEMVPAVHEFVALLRIEMTTEGLSSPGSQPESTAQVPVLQ